MGNDTETIELGRVPQRESPISGLADALAKGMQLGVQKRQVDVQQQQVDVSKEANRQKGELLSYQLEKLRSQNADVATKAVIDRFERVSAHFADKPQEYKNWLTSEAGSFYSKQLKAYAPELVDEGGSPFLIPPKNVATEKLTTLKQELISKVANGTATPEEEKAAYMLSHFPPDALVNIIDVLNKDVRFQLASPQEKARMFAEITKEFNQNQIPTSTGTNKYSQQLGTGKDEKDNFFGA